MMNPFLGSSLLATVLASSWSHGVPVNLEGSRIELLSVASDWASDYDVINRRQGAVYYNDCLVWRDQANSRATHVQFVFAAVTMAGEVKREALPLDIRISYFDRERSGERSSCRDHAYANGTDGFWLVAWVNEVDFADGTSWHAPPLEKMQPHIRSELAKSVQ